MIRANIFYFVFCLLSFFITGCHSLKWNSIDTSNLTAPPANIKEIFNKYENGIMLLEAKNPGSNYSFDIGEKDPFYNDSLNFRFRRLEIKLLPFSPDNKVLVNISFIDPNNNRVVIDEIDLMRLIPRFDTKGDLMYPEMIEEEYNRFGYTFRKEHKEFSIYIDDEQNEILSNVSNRAYRCQLVNNCLSPTKWEFVLVTEDYHDFKDRLHGKTNLNQNRILSHSWFNLDEDLYQALIKMKNPELNVDVMIDYDSLSNMAENTSILFDELRQPIKYRVKSELLEIGSQSGRVIEPLDNEQYYKGVFRMFMEGSSETYKSVLQAPIKTTQFKNEGFYTERALKEFDLNWMQYLDSVDIDVVDIEGTDAYVEITLSGQWSPYKINIGNVDLTLLSEQKLYGLLFGMNTYPKNRRYNPKQSTIAYDADLIPDNVKPYVLLTKKDSDLWVNNQYKGIEKIYLTYESLESDVLEIYVLSYERIMPVWMAKVKLPKEIREKVRIRKRLYSY